MSSAYSIENSIQNLSPTYSYATAAYANCTRVTPYVEIFRQTAVAALPIYTYTHIGISILRIRILATSYTQLLKNVYIDVKSTKV